MGTLTKCLSKRCICHWYLSFILFDCPNSRDSNYVTKLCLWRHWAFIISKCLLFWWWYSSCQRQTIFYVSIFDNSSTLSMHWKDLCDKMTDDKTVSLCILPFSPWPDCFIENKLKRQTKSTFLVQQLVQMRMVFPLVNLRIIQCRHMRIQGNRQSGMDKRWKVD